MLGLRFCVRAFSSCGERGPLFIAVRRPFTVAASLVAEHRLQTRRLSSCGSRASLLCGMWDLPRPGLEPVSPASAGRFSTTEPPRKPPSAHFLTRLWGFIILSCVSCLYVLDINPLSVISFANIFPHSVSCLFILLMVCFAVQKLLSLIRSNLFILTFGSLVWGDRSKKLLLRLMSKSVLPMFSSRIFMVFGLTFKSLIHFEFIFVYSVIKSSNFFLLHVAVQFS